MQTKQSLIAILIGVMIGAGGTMLLEQKSQPADKPADAAPQVPPNVPAIRGEGVGVLPDTLAPVTGEPLRNAARKAEVDKAAREYRRLYEKFGIDGK